MLLCKYEYYQLYYEKKMKAEEDYAMRVSERQDVLRERREKRKGRVSENLGDD